MIDPSGTVGAGVPGSKEGNGRTEGAELGKRRKGPVRILPRPPVAGRQDVLGRGQALLGQAPHLVTAGREAAAEGARPATCRRAAGHALAGRAAPSTALRATRARQSQEELQRPRVKRAKRAKHAKACKACPASTHRKPRSALSTGRAPRSLPASCSRESSLRLCEGEGFN